MKDTLLLTKNNNEKRAILRQKTRETKIRKEVTFKAFGGEISKDDGAYCYAKRIRNDPFSAGTLTSSKTKLKHCYMNGSVVDSEAIGGISVVDEAEPIKGATSHRRDHHYAEQLAKMIPIPTSLGLAMPQERFNNWGKKHSVTRTATILGKNSSASDANVTNKPLKMAFTSLFTTTHFQVPYNDTKLPENQKTSQITSDKNITVIPKVLYLDEELRHRKIPHPACPVHSRGNLTNPHVASDGTWANTCTVPKVTIEHSVKPLQDCKIPLLTSVTLTPQAFSATKPNSHSHTYPKLLKPIHLKSPPKKIPQNICVSVQDTTGSTPSPPPSYVYTVAMRSRKAFCANTYKTHTLCPEMIPPDSEDSTEQGTLHSIHKTHISNATNTTNILHVAPKCTTLSLSTNALKSDHPSHLTSLQPDPSEPQEKPHSSTVGSSAGKMAFIDKINSAKFPTTSTPPDTMAQHSLRSTTFSQSTLNHKANPDQVPRTITEHRSADAQIHSTPPNCLTSKPTPQISVLFLHKTVNASQVPYSKSDLPATYTLKATCPGELDKNVACRSTKFNLKTTPASFLSPLAEKQKNISLLSTSSLQLTDTTKALNCNEARDTNKAHHTQATHMRHQGSNECSAWDDIPNQESNSRKAPLTSRNHNVLTESKDHENPNCSHVTNTQNYNCFVKSSGSSLQPCLNTEQQRLARYQGCTEKTCERHCATFPPVKTNTEHAHQLPLGATAIHANDKLKSDADRQTQCSVSSASVTTQTKCGPTVSHANTQVRCHTSSSTCQNFNFLITLQKQAHTTPEHSVTAPASFNGEGELGADAGPECESILPSSTMPLASRAHVQPGEVQEHSRTDSKCCPGVPQSSTENTTQAHSHPADAVLLLPRSPQCCKSAALEQRLKAVEASLAANKDRITTLLNIIHDLETTSTPSSRSVCACFSEGLWLCSSLMGVW